MSLMNNINFIEELPQQYFSIFMYSVINHHMSVQIYQWFITVYSHIDGLVQDYV